MIFTYASSRSQPPADKFEVTAVNGTAALEQRNFYIQYANRAGRSLLSSSHSVTSTGVLLTLKDGLILPEEEVFWIIISYETTGNPQDAGIVAMWQARGSNQMTRRSLPASLYFYSEDHFVVNRAVASADELPSSPNYNNGSIVLVADTGIYYRADHEAYDDNYGINSYGSYSKGLPWKQWIEWPGNFNAYVESTSSFRGCDVPLSLVNDSLEIPPKVADGDSTPIRYWFNNGLSSDGGSPVVEASYSIQVAVDGLEGYEGFFADKIKYYLRGYINRETGVLDDTIPTVGTLQYWNPGTGAITLPAELPRNHAAVYDIILSFDNVDSIGILPGQSPEIALNFTQIANTQGTLNEGANLIGNLVYQDRGKLLVVPGTLRLPGIASIKIENASKGYLIDAKDSQSLVGLLPDTANQIVAMSGVLNGYCTVRQAGEALAFSEVVRATVSTATGISVPVAMDTPLVLSNEGIRITVTHPITSGLYATIRNNYPDELIAGLDALFTPVTGYVYLEVDGILYRSGIETITSAPTQSFNYTSLNSFTQISALPSPASSFCLFEIEQISATAITGSITGTVTASFAYAYETPNYRATAIDNRVSGGIITSSISIAEVIGSLDGLFTRFLPLLGHLDDLNNPHQLTREQIGAASQTEVDSLKTSFKQVNASYAVTTADFHHIIEFTNVTDQTLTLDHTQINTAQHNPFEFMVRRLGTGKVMISVTGGAALESVGNSINTVYETVYFAYKATSNSWAVIGNLSV